MSMKNDFWREYRLLRLYERREQGYDPEDWPVVNLRHDGQMVRVIMQGMTNALVGDAARRALSKRYHSDPLPHAPGAVSAAAASRAEARVRLNNGDAFADIFGVPSPACALASARARTCSTPTGYYTLPDNLRACGNARLNAVRVILRQDYSAASSDAEQAAIGAQIAAIDAEISRRYLSTPDIMYL